MADMIREVLVAVTGGVLLAYAMFLWHITIGHRNNEKQSVVAAADDDPPTPRTPPSAL